MFVWRIDIQAYGTVEVKDLQSIMRHTVELEFYPLALPDEFTIQTHILFEFMIQPVVELPIRFSNGEFQTLFGVTIGALAYCNTEDKVHKEGEDWSLTHVHTNINKLLHVDGKDDAQ
ncbi:hypothetical protein F2P81_023505 [Scophthalmus maximus]|uniref:Uncharacterized protein n=1 Tax=Scophthalmus maximus TaxID=52904 RepID=A0A6A4RRQ3_SCOMX|nr:hypothetical protein F2P81_023505 [Scophthalmus maximus]